MGDQRRSRVVAEPSSSTSSTTSSSSPPCGACKFLRRKCTNGCIFAPYFGTDQGAARFAAVHKVFGASNVSKLLTHIPTARRHDAVVTISYEAQARLSDPVYGCVSTILALQHQVANLQAELSVVQSQLINSRVAFETSSQQQHPSAMGILQQHQQPTYSSNNSSASNHLVSGPTIDMSSSCFTANYIEQNATPPPLHPPSATSHLFLDRLHQQDHEDDHTRIAAFANLR